MVLAGESLSRALSYSLILAVLVFVGDISLCDRLLCFFYGADFARGYQTVVVLLAVQVVNLFQFFFTMYLYALDFPKESFKFISVGIVVNIVLNVVVVPVITNES